MRHKPSQKPALDPLIHEPARLLIVSVLSECDVADFNFLLHATSLTRGNLSTHMAKLVAAGYVREKKEFIDRRPHTEYQLTRRGELSYRDYRKAWRQITNDSAG